jgi:hypothetical protein
MSENTPTKVFKLNIEVEESPDEKITTFTITGKAPKGLLTGLTSLLSHSFSAPTQILPPTPITAPEAQKKEEEKE